MDDYNSLYIVKIVFFCIEYTSLIIITIIWFLRENRHNCDDCWKNCLYVLFFIVNLFYCIYFIIISVCLDCHRLYVENFMNKINFDFEKQKNDYKWNVAVLMHYIFSAFYILIYFPLNENYKKIFEFNNDDYNKITSGEEGRIIHIIHHQPTNPNEQNENSNNFENLNRQITNSNRIIEGLTNERDTYKMNYLNLQNSVQRLKSSLPFKDLAENEKLMNIIISTGGNNYPFICKNIQIFSEVEEKFIEKYPDFIGKVDCFLSHGFPVDKNSTVEDNGIKDGETIIIKVND